jgi:hypothetical protein
LDRLQRSRFVVQILLIFRWCFSSVNGTTFEISTDFGGVFGIATAWLMGASFGRALFHDGAHRVAHSADAIGIRGIVVHAISEEARRFYLALGFDPCPGEPMMLVVTLSDVRAALS